MTVTPFGSRSTAPRRDDGLQMRDARSTIVVELDAQLERDGGRAQHVHQVAAAEQRHLAGRGVRPA